MVYGIDVHVRPPSAVLSKSGPVSSWPMAKPTVGETKSRLDTSLKTWLTGGCIQCFPPSRVIKSGEMVLFPPCDGPLVAQPWFISTKSTMTTDDVGCATATLFHVFPPSWVTYRPKPEFFSLAK